MTERKTTRLPHTLVLLFALMVAALVLTWALPAGAFETEEDEGGREIVVAGTYERAEDPPLLTPLALLTAVPRALADAHKIVFFVLIVGGVLAVIRKTGAIDAFLGFTLRRFGDRVGLLLFAAMLVFGVASSTFGMAEEYIPLAAILISLCVGLRLDTMAAIGAMVAGYCIGYGAATLNPFTVMVAQDVAGVAPGSGLWLRAAIFLPLLFLGFFYVYRYALRVRADPSSSLVADIPEAQPPPSSGYPPLTRARSAIVAAMAGTVALLVVGIAVWDWYLEELSALFLGLGLVAAIAGRLGADRTAREFGAGASELTMTALLIGFARAIALILEDGEVLHTIVYGLSAPLSAVGSELAAVGMLAIQSALNLVISSGSGQALVTMPLMAPIGDLAGVGPQVSVLAFQFGDGFMNMVAPTNAVLMSILGIAGIPYERWLRFILPLVGLLLAAAALILVAAVWLEYA